MLRALALVGMLAAGCADVTAAEARRLVAGGALLADVRSPAEYAAGHIEGAVNLPVDELAARVASLPRRPIVVYCHTGIRAARAASLLRAAGFTVHDLGAMNRWYADRPPSLF